ncbi:MAG TPA: hypothetical protein VFW78_06970 [Bacteroidia bacterium]|nr:hypothetical protein [Bacteroidia bacterium]
MLAITICLTLLTILASLHFLARVKSENMGMLIRLITWGVLITAGGLLIVQLVRGCNRYRHRNDDCTETTFRMGNGMGMHGGMMIQKEIRRSHGGMHGQHMGDFDEEDCLRMGDRCMMKDGKCVMRDSSDCCDMDATCHDGKSGCMPMGKGCNMKGMRWEEKSDAMDSTHMKKKMMMKK